MKILLDECTPRVVKQRLPGRDVRTVQEMGWSGIKNGELLSLAERQFEVFITNDKNIRYQQSLAGRSFAVLVLPSNQVPIVESLIPSIEEALTQVQAGSLVELPLPS